MARKSTPYVMWGRARAQERPTVADPPDVRVAAINPRQLSPEEIRAILRPGATDPRLRPADRLLERWAVTHGTGAQWPSLATAELVPRAPSARLSPLDDRECLLVDAAVKSSSVWASTFVTLWYRSGATVQEIAQVLKIKRRQGVYEERNLILAYFLGRFAQIGISITVIVGRLD